MRSRLLLPVIGSVALILPGLALSATTLPGFTTSAGVACAQLPARGGAGPTMVCTVRAASYAHTLQARCIGPAGQGVDWHGFTLSAGRKGQVNCSGGALVTGSQRVSHAPLRLGRRWRHAPFTCWSRPGGVTCRDGSGHGLLISRAAWRAW
jgi:hypothetical protein